MPAKIRQQFRTRNIAILSLRTRSKGFRRHSRSTASKPLPPTRCKSGDFVLKLKQRYGAKGDVIAISRLMGGRELLCSSDHSHVRGMIVDAAGGYLSLWSTSRCAEPPIDLAAPTQDADIALCLRTRSPRDDQDLSIRGWPKGRAPRCVRPAQPGGSGLVSALRSAPRSETMAHVRMTSALLASQDFAQLTLTQAGSPCGLTESKIWFIDTLGIIFLTRRCPALT